MLLFLFQIGYIKNFGVRLVCLDESGNVHYLDKPYTPYFFAVDMPPRYRRDIKNCTVEESPQTKPYIGYSDKIYKVVKMRTFNRRMATWKNIHETDAPIERQFSEEYNLNPSCWFDSETMQLTPNQEKVPDFMICSFDIECYSESGEFPDANKPTDCITMICLSFQRFSGGRIQSYVLSLDAEPHIRSDVIVEKCNTEEHFYKDLPIL